MSDDPFLPLETDPTALALDAAARANPDDDLPRLVLADWWDEAGDVAFGAFLRTDAGRGAVVTAVTCGKGVREVYRMLTLLNRLLERNALTFRRAAEAVGPVVQNVARFATEAGQALAYAVRAAQENRPPVPPAAVRATPPAPRPRRKGPPDRRRFPVPR